MLIDRLEMLAAQAIGAGWPVIVESCFLDRANRQRFRAKAAELGAPFVVLECSAPLSAIRERLKKRRAFGSLFHGEDASADDVQERLQAQMERTDSLDEYERVNTITIDTSKQVDHQQLANWVLGLGWRGTDTRSGACASVPLRRPPSECPKENQAAAPQTERSPCATTTSASSK
jgi:predicted kinase